MRKAKRFSEEELAIAKSVDLTSVASHLGYTVRKIGQYHTLKEMDSIRIYRRTHWFRWSRQYDKGENGGSQIDFLRVFHGMEVKEAVFWLLDFAGYQRGNIPLNEFPVDPRTKKKEKIPFRLPEKAKTNEKLYSYLTMERGISKEVVDYFVKEDLIYLSFPHHNIVFRGNDKNGITRFASMRGTYDRVGKSFKCDVPGNDKRYGFQVSKEENNELVVFEAAIDLMSYMDLFEDGETNKLALGMLSDAPLETFLEEHPQITSIRFCLDNDEPGRKATERLMEKYYEKGFEVEDHPPHDDSKDFNEQLLAMKHLVVIQNETINRSR